MKVAATRELSAPGERLALGKRIKQLRLAAGLTLKEFAQRMGCTYANVSLVEVGNYVPSDSKLSAIAGALGAGAAEEELRQLAKLARAARRSSREFGFGAAMAALRRGKSWTQVQLAERMGWSQLYVRSLENGHKSPPFSEICRLSTVLENDKDRGRLARLCMRDLGAISVPIPVGADSEIAEVVVDIASAFADRRLGLEHAQRLSDVLAGASDVEFLSETAESALLELPVA